MANKIGTLRQSQVVTTFGIGAIVDFKNHSAMPLGLEHWPPHIHCPMIREPDLEAMLNVDCFRAPPPCEDARHPERMLSAVRFPRWLYCPKCNALGPVRDIVVTPGPVNESDVDTRHSFEAIESGQAKCMRLKGAKRCDGVGVPTPLVVVCFHDDDQTPEHEHPGHIDDFPWEAWAHRDGDKDKSVSHFLSLVSRGGTLSIEDNWLTCTCGTKPVSLRGVFGMHMLRGYKCWGWQPWLESRFPQKNCLRPIRAFMRGATNIHLPEIKSVISIPPYTDEIFKSLEPYQEIFQNAWRVMRDLGGLLDPSKFAASQFKQITEQGFNSDGHLCTADCEKAIGALLEGVDAGMPRTTWSQRRASECEMLRKGKDAPQSDFDACEVTVPTPWTSYIERVMRVNRLREVSALLGFRRISKGNPDELDNSKFAPLSQELLRWLPAMEMRGEGIFVELNRERVRAWEEMADASDEMNKMRKNFRAFARQNPSATANPPYSRQVLVHTLAHLMLRQLTIECGYASASLRERLYVSPPCPHEPEQEMAGFLIYTSTVDSDGSLGGLVRMGESARFFPALQDALNVATWCSSDPVCLQSEGQGADSLNLAACHACALVPETSCELYNRILNRSFVIAAQGSGNTSAYFPIELFNNAGREAENE